MLDIKKILLPIDFSARSTDTAEAAAAIAEHFHSDMILLHVVALRAEAFLAPAGQHKVIQGFAREEAEERMEAFQRHHWPQLKVQRVLREGDPAETILEYAESERVNLIMMPTRGCGPFRRLLLGSVTAKVLHDAKCPVWTAAHSQEKPLHLRAKPRRIAAAVDLQPHSKYVLRSARRLSSAFQAPLSVIHVAPLDPRLEDYYVSPEWRADVIRGAERELAELMKANGVTGEILIEVGSVPDAITERTRERQADLLVIGRNGHGGGHLPTNAYAVIRKAPCPVLGV